MIDQDTRRQRAPLRSPWLAQYLLSLFLVLSGALAPASSTGDIIEPFLPPPPEDGDFIGNFLKPEFLLPVGGGEATDVGGDLAAVYSRIFYKIEPGMELLIVGEFPRARYFSLAVYDDHGTIIDTIADRDVLPLVEETGNPYAIGGPAGQEDLLYVASVRFGDQEILDPLPQCDNSDFDLRANLLDARFRHSYHDRYSDLQTNFVVWTGSASLFLPHDDAIENTGGMVGVRIYLPGEPGWGNQFDLTTPLMWLRDVNTGCAYQLSSEPGQVIEPEEWYDGPDVVRQSSVFVHTRHEEDLGLVTPPDGIPQDGNGLQFYGGNEYRLHDNPDTSFVTSLVGAVNAPTLLNRDGRVLRLDVRLPEVPCSRKICELTGEEELRYWGLSFIDDANVTFYTLPDVDVVRDADGYSTIIATFGTELPDFVTAANGYTVVQLLQDEALDLKWITLRNILPADLPPDHVFECSTANVPFRTSEHHPNGGHMSEYLPNASYPFAAALPQAADRLEQDDEGCAPPEERPPPECCAIAGTFAWEGYDATFTVWRTTALDTRVVDWFTSDLPAEDVEPGQAEGGKDYEAASGTLTFLPGEAKMTFSVTTLDDADVEGNEIFHVNIADADTGIIFSAGTVEGTIVDDEIPVFRLSVENTEEGALAVATVTRSSDEVEIQTIDYKTTIGELNTAETTDFTAVSGTLSFEPGELEETFEVQILEDEEFEGNETFSIVLTDVMGGTYGGNIKDSIANVTIEDNDCCGVSRGDAFEGESLEFTIWRKAEEETQSVSYFTADLVAGVGFAVAGIDYTSGSGTLTFLPGQIEKTVVIEALQDELEEGNELFEFILADAQSGDPIENGTVEVEILDDDVPVFSISTDDPVIEGGDLTVTVTRSLDIPETQTIDYVTRVRASDTTSEDDFVQTTGVLSFEEGELQKSFVVPTLDDEVYEEDETFTLRLANVMGGPFGGNEATDGVKTTISDDDCCGVDSDRTWEGETFVFTVSRANTQVMQDIDFATADLEESAHAAEAGVDYVAVSGSLHFEAGESQKTVLVTVLSDEEAEGDEFFDFNLLDPEGEVLEGGSKLGWILDDDIPSYDISVGSVIEGDAVTATVTRSMDWEEAQTVDYDAAIEVEEGNEDTADRNDFFATSGTLEFEPGDLQMTFEIRTTDDGLIEEDETFTAVIRNVQGGEYEGNVRENKARVTITDDDAERRRSATKKELSRFRRVWRSNQSP